jgi:hypothetical protein
MMSQLAEAFSVKLTLPLEALVEGLVKIPDLLLTIIQ